MPELTRSALLEEFENFVTTKLFPERDQDIRISRQYFKQIRDALINRD